MRVDADDVAVANPAERPAGDHLGADMDRRRHLARRAAHPAVGDESDAKALLLQRAERRRQLVQLGHAVGARPLEADDGDEIALELAGGERGEHVVL